jgi:hypothetical protein
MTEPRKINPPSEEFSLKDAILNAMRADAEPRKINPPHHGRLRDIALDGKPARIHRTKQDWPWGASSSKVNA